MANESQLTTVSLPSQPGQVCDHFECAWLMASSPDHRPRIEHYLAAIPDPDCPAVLRELIALDVAYRRRAGEDPRPEEYRQRFPHLDPGWMATGFRPGPAGNRSGAPGPAAAPVWQPAAARLQRIRCPHCHNPIQLVDEQPEEVLCPGCGSTFRVRDARLTETVSPTRPLGKFQLLDRVGMGAFGAVWRARDTVLDRIVALKIPHTGLLTREEDLERFYREARAAAQLRHPGIVSLHEVVTLDGLPVLVTEFITGAPLRELVQVRPLTFREASVLVAEVAEALHYAHEMGLVHRDIKPANIMVEIAPPGAGRPARAPRRRDPEFAQLGWPLLMDFGLALRDDAEVTMTLEGQIIGTPAYMSPEQAAGKGHQVDARSDI
jgi:hypothetical protein